MRKITWSEMRKENVQAKMVHSLTVVVEKRTTIEESGAKITEQTNKLLETGRAYRTLSLCSACTLSFDRLRQ